MGMSCISQVQLPCGRLPGNGQVLPEFGSTVFECILNIVIHYRWDDRAKHTQLSFLSASGSLGCNSNLYTSLPCTDACYSCTISDHFQTKWKLTFPFPDPRHNRSRSYRFPGLPYNSRMDRARPREPSIDRHSLLPGRKSPPQRCCPGGSRWRCSCGWRTWRRCQRNPPRRCLWRFLEIIPQNLQVLFDPWHDGYNMMLFHSVDGENMQKAHLDNQPSCRHQPLQDHQDKGC